MFTKANLWLWLFHASHSELSVRIINNLLCNDCAFESHVQIHSKISLSLIKSGPCFHHWVDRREYVWLYFVKATIRFGLCRWTPFCANGRLTRGGSVFYPSCKKANWQTLLYTGWMQMLRWRSNNLITLSPLDKKRRVNKHFGYTYHLSSLRGFAYISSILLLGVQCSSQDF